MAEHVIDCTARVVHAYYGCDTGCCGHAVEVVDRLGKILERTFIFDHPYGDDHCTFARNLAEEHAPQARLDLEECSVADD